MSVPSLASLDEIAAAFVHGGYVTERSKLAERPAVLAESPYAFIGCVELPDFAQLEERVFDVQADLTRRAALGPSARNWDLYLLVHVTAPADTRDRSEMEAIEADTRYARKLVHDALAPAELDRALRPLLPLRQVDSIDLVDPLALMREELHATALDPELVELAIATFRQDGAVRVP